MKKKKKGSSQSDTTQILPFLEFCVVVPEKGLFSFKVNWQLMNEAETMSYKSANLWKSCFQKLNSEMSSRGPKNH